MPRQREVEGDVVRIDLGDGTHAYARVLPGGFFAFYDLRTAGDPSVPDILGRPVLFKILVMRHAVTRGRWVRVGRSPLEPDLKAAPETFIQDKLNPRNLYIYRQGAQRPATRQECEGLECTAVWDPTHVEDRLRDHYAGRPNKWLESMRIIPAE